MKKIFTLFAGLLMTVAVFAADRRPTVTVNSSRNYKIVIDGRSYFGSNFMSINLDNNYGSFDSYGNSYGRQGSRIHTIKVYELRRGFFVRERLVDAATFMVGRDDILIKVDMFGQIRIREMKDFGRYDRNGRGYNGMDRGNNSWDDRRWNDGQEYDGHNTRGQDQIGNDNRDPRDNRDGRGGRGF